MCIAHTKIFFYFTPGNQFKIVGFFCSPTGNRSFSTAQFKFKFEFDQFKPVTGQTGPVNRNWWPAV